MSNNQLEIIAKAVGPAPWYSDTFPAIITSSGQHLLWWALSISGHRATASLGPESKLREYRLSINMYVRAFLIPPLKIGLWYSQDGKIHILGFDPDNLHDFSLDELAYRFGHSKQLMYYAGGKPEFDFASGLDLPEGVHRMDFPAALQDIDEFFIVASWPAPIGERRGQNDPAYVIWALEPAKSQVRVFPQMWFTRKQFDLGYQWITRVVRDPETGRIIGDGIRVGPFELTEDGCNLERWLTA